MGDERSTIDTAVTGMHPERPHGMGLDKGDDDDAVREMRAEFGCTAHSNGRGEEARVLKREAGKWAG